MGIVDIQEGGRVQQTFPKDQDCRAGSDAVSKHPVGSNVFRGLPGAGGELLRGGAA